MTKTPRYRAPTVEVEGAVKPISIIHAHKWWGEQARNDVFRFGEFVYGYKPAAHHKRWIEIIENGEKEIIVAPRESAKTTWVCNIYMTWKISKLPFLTNAIISVSEDQAKRRLRAIKDIILQSENYKWAFPTIHLDERKSQTVTTMNVWDSRLGSYRQWLAWAHRNYPETRNNHSLKAAGITSSGVIGDWYTGIVLFDDIHDKKNVNTKETIDTVEDQVKLTYMPCIRPGGKAIIIGTRWAEDDIIGRTKNANRDMIPEARWGVDETTILIEDPRTGIPESYWPDEWPMSRIRKKESEDKLTFQLMYMNDTQALSGLLFKPKYLGQMLPPMIPPLDRVYVTVDPAFTTKTRSDFTAIITVGFTKTGQLFTLKVDRGRFDKPEMRMVMNQHYMEAESKYGRCDGVLVEEAGAGVLLVQDLKDETLLPIIGVLVAGQGDKTLKAGKFSVLVSHGDYYCDWDSSAGHTHKLELLAFPTGAHDDTVDAVALAVNYYYKNGFSQPKHHVITIEKKPKLTRI